MDGSVWRWCSAALLLLAGCGPVLQPPERRAASHDETRPILQFNSVTNRSGLLASDGLLYRVTLWRDGVSGSPVILEGEWSDLDADGNAAHPGASVAVAIRNRGAEETVWEIRVEPEAGYSVYSVEFPILLLRKPRAEAAERLIVPNQLGQLIANPSEEPERENGLRPRLKKALWYGTYGALQSMQMLLYECDEEGVMIWTQDPEGYLKDYEVSRDVRAGAVGLRCSVHHFPEQTGQPGTAWRSPYPVVTTGYRGGWHTAAERYRAWAVRQPWCTKGTILERVARGELPDWYARNPLWITLLNAGSLSYLLPYLDQFAQDDVQIGCFLTMWQRWPFDDRNPEYFPPKDPPGLARLVALQARGMHLFPYMNAQLVHIDYPPVRDRWLSCAALPPADPAAMQPRNGRAWPDYLEMWGTDPEQTTVWRERVRAAWAGPVDEALLREIASPAFPDLDYRREALARELRQAWGKGEAWQKLRARNRFAPMCRAHEDWREGFVAMAWTNLQFYGEDGQYLDQLCAAVYPCWARDHGHPPGFGRSFLQGSRRMAERIREECPGKVLFMERMCEFYIGAVEESYAIDPDYRRQTVLPLFPAVYHDYASAHEWNVPQETLERMEDFTSAVAESMHAGHKVGSFVSVETWMRLLKPGYAAPREWIARLVRLQRRHMEEWTYGRRLRDPLIRPARAHTVRVFQDAKLTERIRPVVEGSCWAPSEDPDRAILVLSNCGAATQAVQVTCEAWTPGTPLVDDAGRTVRYDPATPLQIEPFAWRVLRAAAP